jgi:hypothetical protein
VRRRLPLQAGDVLAGLAGLGKAGALQQHLAVAVVSLK